MRFDIRTSADYSFTSVTQPDGEAIGYPDIDTYCYS